MSEEQSTGFDTATAQAGVHRILELGRDPWQVRSLRGTVSFKRADADQLDVTALDFAGRPAGKTGAASRIPLQPATLYYLIQPR
jgi:hypothetical protein